MCLLAHKFILQFKRHRIVSIAATFYKSLYNNRKRTSGPVSFSFCILTIIADLFVILIAYWLLFHTAFKICHRQCETFFNIRIVFQGHNSQGFPSVLVRGFESVLSPRNVDFLRQHEAAIRSYLRQLSIPQSFGFSVCIVREYLYSPFSFQNCHLDRCNFEISDIVTSFFMLLTFLFEIN